MYGELTNVPLIIRWPARLPAARVIDDLVQSIDIMPTMLELSGIAHPAGLQGQSLRPFLTPTPQANLSARRPGQDGSRARPFRNECPTSRAPREELSRESVSIIDGNWKLIHNTVRPPGLPEFELFDYYKDPLNKQNVAADHPDVVARLSKLIAGWRQMATAARAQAGRRDDKGHERRGTTAVEKPRLRSLRGGG